MNKIIRISLIIMMIIFSSCSTTRYYKRIVPKYQSKIVETSRQAFQNSKSNISVEKKDFDLIEFANRDSTIEFLDNLTFLQKKLKISDFSVQKESFPKVMPDFQLDSVVFMSTTSGLLITNDHYFLVDIQKQPRPYNDISKYGERAPGEPDGLHKKFQRMAPRLYYWEFSVWDVYKN